MRPPPVAMSAAGLVSAAPPAPVPPGTLPAALPPGPEYYEEEELESADEEDGERSARARDSDEGGRGPRPGAWGGLGETRTFLARRGRVCVV